LVMRVAREAHRLAEEDAILDRQRKRTEQPEPRPRERDRKRRHAEQPGERHEVRDRDRLLLGADDGDRDDRRVGLERKPHEPVAELLQLIALPEELVMPFTPSGKAMTAS